MTDPRIADHIIALAADPALRPHPEETCERCGGLNVLSWHAPSPLWNAVLRDPVTREDRWSIICPRCFAELAEESVVGSSAGWHWAPCGEPLPEWDMGDGRIWDPERCLWVGGSVPPLVGDAGADRPRSTGPGVSTSQQTLAEALQAILDDVSDVRRGMIVLAPDLAADAILATDPGSRLTVSESQKLSDSSDPDAERQRAIDTFPGTRRLLAAMDAVQARHAIVAGTDDNGEGPFPVAYCQHPDGSYRKVENCDAATLLTTGHQHRPWQGEDAPEKCVDCGWPMPDGVPFAAALPAAQEPERVVLTGDMLTGVRRSPDPHPFLPRVQGVIGGSCQVCGGIGMDSQHVAAQPERPVDLGQQGYGYPDSSDIER
jgi:hypothetical protein